MSCLGVVKAGEIPRLGNQGDGGSELHPAQRLRGFDDRTPAPVLHQGLELRFQALQAFGLCRDGPDVFLKDTLVGGRRTDHLGAKGQPIPENDIQIAAIAWQHHPFTNSHRIGSRRYINWGTDSLNMPSAARNECQYVFLSYEKG
jgi:hypothetical protein